jgi:hypothetical protein
MRVHRGPMKKDLTPLSKKGQIVTHQGKGARPFPPQPRPQPLGMGAPSMNDYAKQTPLPTPPAGGPTPNPFSSGGDDTQMGQNNGMV